MLEAEGEPATARKEVYAMEWLGGGGAMGLGGARWMMLR